MVTFSERISDLMAEKEVKSNELAAIIGVNATTITDWKRGKYHIHLTHAIKLADFFECSLEYLMGRSEDFSDFKSKKSPPFYTQFLSVMAECNCTTYRIRRDSGISGGHFNNWKKGSDPLMPTLFLVADYLDVTLDYLVGRES
ncbi:MAG: helix-turn-helix domain-containing protein [Firmicutes bacterium]|nr:helix-turn-helix domain-containing protein [Bacillota bacterium]